MRQINKAVVLGAGAMGSGIAAQLANAGVEVALLDIVPKDAADRDIIAKNAIQRMLKATPATDPLNAGFMIPENAQRITPGNIEDHLETFVRDADWIVEAVIENLDVKLALFEKLEKLKKPDAIVSSNTSTIPLRDLVQERSDDFKRHFLITHFFNPPRFMHLLEIVPGELTDPEITCFMQAFGDIRLGKNVIICKDTPAFLANRIGIYFMFRAITETLETGMPVEKVDALLGSPIGFPKEGIFGLLDLVGIGIIPLVTESLLKTLAPDDSFRAFDHTRGLALVNGLLKEGRTGRNSPHGGFYRMHKTEDGKKRKQAINLTTGEYYDFDRPKLSCVKAAKKQGPRALFESDDEFARFAWVVVRDTLLYAAALMPEIADDIADVDAALRGGYNAHWGPFELIDKLGADWFRQKVLADGLSLPPVLELAAGRSFYMEREGKRFRLQFDFKAGKAEYAELTSPEGILRLSDVKRRSKPLLSHHSASLWDLGDGVACLEFHSKMNTLDPSVLWVANESIRLIQGSPHLKALVIYNEAPNFSLGANIGLLQAGFALADAKPVKMLGLSEVIRQGAYRLVDALVLQGQSVFNALRNAPFPVVGAPNGMALGGGCEILLHCDAIQANAETYMGLVESGVGLVPGWGGCARYLERCLASDGRKGGAIPPVRQAFQTILMPQMSVSTSAQDARKKLWLRPHDGITMNPDRVLADAKAKALSLVDGYQPPSAAVYALPGPSGKSALRMAVDDFYMKGDATYHDVVVADALADILTGGETFAGKPLTDSDIAQLERENFLSLLRTSQTRERIAHTLKTGKPLREAPLEGKADLDEIRAELKPFKRHYRFLSGQPLQGRDASQLKWMADVTAFLLKRLS